jgi:hypothetical protein
MKFKSSLPCSQESATEPSPELDESSPTSFPFPYDKF